MKVLIRNGRVVDPHSGRNGPGRDGLFDVLCEGGRITQVEKKGQIKTAAETIIDASGCVVAPGFIDLHSHLREPGYGYKETIESGTLSAAAGGFTSVVCMANTNPVNDNAVITELIIKKAQEKGSVNVFPVGAISRGLEGKTLADIGQMCEAGIVGISDDGRCVMDSALMRKALQYAKGFNLLVISHAEDENLSGEGSINEGLVATELGLPGSPNAAEEIIIARDIALAELTSARLHIAHLTTRGGLELIRAAKKRGVLVSCEVTPHHFSLTDEAVRGYNTQAKVRPPLRTAEDVEALCGGLKDGTIDVIATDHAPHATFEKEVEFIRAANGLVGFETALPLAMNLVSRKIISLNRLVELLSTNPAKILGKDRKGRIEPGADADVTLFSPDEKIKIDVGQFHSKSVNSPFQDWTLAGKVKYTLVAGRVVYRA